MTDAVIITPPPEIADMLNGNFEALEIAIRATIPRVAVEFKPLIAAYPEEGPYNQPGPYPHRWYQRNKGPRWARKDGTIGGRNTSEQLQYSWKQETGDDQIRTWTEVGYAPYVVGNQITDYHEAHGWKRIEDIANDYADRALEILLEEIDKVLE